MGKAMRLDKFLAEMGLGTRSQVKELLKKGRIQVGDSLCREPERKIDPEQDKVLFDGSPLSYEAFEYFLLNKPQGVVSATRDNLHRTVVDLIGDSNSKDLFPVGRLDLDTEGLLILTNDGRLAHRLLSPKRHVDKVYFARIEGKLPEDAKDRFQEGIRLSDGTETLPGTLCILDEGEMEAAETDRLTQVTVTIREGKFHQVKRMFEALGCRVIYLKRLSMGGLTLDPKLKPGEYRRLTREELRQLEERGDQKEGQR